MLTQPMTDPFTSLSVASSQMHLTQVNNQMTLANHPTSPNVVSVVSKGNKSPRLPVNLFNNQPQSHVSSFNAQSNSPTVVSGAVLNNLLCVTGSQPIDISLLDSNQQIYAAVVSNSPQQNFDNGQNNHMFQTGVSSPVRICQNLSSAQSPGNIQNIAVSFSQQHSPGLSPNSSQINLPNGFSQVHIQNSMNLPTSIESNNFATSSSSQDVNMSQSIPSHDQFSSNAANGYAVSEKQKLLHGLLSSSVNSLPTQNGNVQNVQRFALSNSCLQQINATPLMATSSAGTNQQKGYSDVAMRLLQQLLVKSTSNNPQKANEAGVQNSLPLHHSNGHLITSPSGLNQQVSSIQTHPTLQFPMMMNAQAMTSPSVQQKPPVSNQGLLHQILSQGLETRNIQAEPMTSQTSPRGQPSSPQIQQLDSLRLQAMAQQVQQQAQSVQTAQHQTNGK